MKSRDEIAAWLVAQVADLLGVSPEEIRHDEPLTYYGLGSADGAILSGDLEDWLGCGLPATVAWEHPTIAALADYLVAANAAGVAEPADSRLSPTGRIEPGDHPLSYSQRSLWFLYQLAPASSAYHITQAAWVRSPLDVDALRRAFLQLAERHASLRTTFPLVDGEPVQRIGDTPALEFECEDGRDWSDLALRQRLEREATRPFRLEEGPLLRVQIYRRPANEHVMIVAAHHIIADFWSFSVLIREVCALYEGIVVGEFVSLPPLPGSYADHTRAQLDLLKGPDGERLWAYWQRQLGGMTDRLDLPSDRPRPRVQGFRGSSLSAQLSGSLVRKVRALAARENVTLFTFLLAAFAALLHRYGGQEEIVLGSPTSGRRRREQLGIVGYFVNPVVLRLDLSGNPGFVELLKRTRDTVLEALEHQEFPFAHLVERLRPRRDAARSPLFQALFTMQQTALPQDRAFVPFALGEHAARLEIGGLVLEALPLPQHASQFDVSLMVGDLGDDVALSWQYDSDLFEPSSIERLAGHYQALLEGIVERPEGEIAALPMLSPAERSLLLDEWSHGERTEGPDLCVTRAFEAQVASQPETIALELEGATQTYNDLNCRANRLARHLRRLGVGGEDRVGVCFDRSFELIGAILAVLKAGAAYVPLDPDLPAERIGLMARDAAIAVLLCDEHHADILADHSCAVVVVDAAESLTREYDDGDLEVAPALGSLSQILFTSGSTGVPKGVLLEHRGIANRLEWLQSYHPLRPTDRVLQRATVGFDVSVWEIFWPLVTGARLVLARPGRHADASYLVATIRRDRITIVQFVPSLLRAFLDLPEAADCMSLRLVVSSGDVLTADLRRRFYEVLSAQLVNFYGPTEVSDTVAAWRCGRDDVDECVPIGRPIRNTSVYVLDRLRQPVPIGVAGVLHVGGAGVARGYLNQPALTRERFLPHPFSAENGARLYDTGDLVRHRKDGALEILGRVDGQIKVNGCRIEPGEVESALRRHPDVGEVVVTTRGERSQLLAYAVAAGEQRPAARELRLFLRSLLPSYMVPGRIIVLDGLPRSPNGKIDRKALPPPATESATIPVPPRNAVETLLCSLWRAVLGVERLGIDDDFFDLGGDSLAAVKLAGLVSSALERDVRVKEVLLNPTVRALAESLAADALPRVRDRSASPPSSAPRVALPRSASESPGRIDAAAIAYLPRSVLEALGVPAVEITGRWMGDAPSLALVHETALGRIGLVLLPMFDVDLFADDRGRLRREVGRALEVARRSGAGVVSLTGVIPSLTNHGRDLHDLATGVALTTGHATTVAAVVLSLERCLREAARPLQSARVAVVGLGSIGTAVLYLLLERLPHPVEILLCDVYGHAAELERIRDVVRSRFDFGGAVRVLVSRGDVPAELYAADVILGATTAADVVDVDRLRSGTLVVDDSAPHCFAVDRALRRLESRGDVLLCEGGILRAPGEIGRVWHLPAEIDPEEMARHVGELDALDGQSITGCVLSGLLTVRFPELVPTLGMDHTRTATTHLDKLVELGFTAPPLRLAGRRLEAEVVSRFGRRFGDGRTARESG